MNEKKSRAILRKLSRQDLLEMLIAEEKRIEALEKELEEVKAELEDRNIKINNSGSIAEAALKLNGIFEAAQAAADLYLENVRHQTELKGKENEKTTGTAGSSDRAAGRGTKPCKI